MKGRIFTRQVVTMSLTKEIHQTNGEFNFLCVTFSFKNSKVICFPSSNSSFFCSNGFRAAILCLLIYSLMDMTGNPLGNTPCHFISRQSFCPKVYGRPEDSALNSLHSSTQIPTKRWLASCPVELETVYSTFLCVSLCLPVVSSIFDGNKSTPSCFFFSFIQGQLIPF